MVTGSALQVHTHRSLPLPCTSSEWCLLLPAPDCCLSRVSCPPVGHRRSSSNGILCWGRVTLWWWHTMRMKATARQKERKLVCRAGHVLYLNMNVQWINRSVQKVHPALHLSLCTVLYVNYVLMKEYVCRWSERQTGRQTGRHLHKSSIIVLVMIPNAKLHFVSFNLFQYLSFSFSLLTVIFWNM